MGCPAQGVLGTTLVFTVTTRDAAGAQVDADSAPAYRVYEDEGAAVLMTGSMSLFDDPNTTGFYAETINLTAANGFEPFKTYTIYVTGLIAGTTVNKSFNFVCLRAETIQELATGPVSNTEVLAVVNERLNRDETSVDRELRAALKRMTGALDLLQETAEIALAVGEMAVDLPADFKRLEAIEVDGVALQLMTRDEALECKVEPSTNPPSYYNVWDGQILFDTLADTAYTVCLSFAAYHPGDVATILLGEEFREAIYALTTSLVADRLGGLDGDSDRWLNRYQQEMTILARLEPSQPRCVRYRDL